jgi:hypothetical protein
MIKKLSECSDVYLHQGHPRRIAFYRDRHRGAREPFQVFLVLETPPNGLTWWCEPLAYVSSSDDLFSRLLQEGKCCTDSMIAGGTMDTFAICFSYLRDSMDIPDLVARTFGAAQDKMFDAYEYDNADVRAVDSHSLGSVKTIVERFGYSLPPFEH